MNAKLEVASKQKKMPKVLDDFSIKAMKAAANAAVGLDNLKIIIEAIGELSGQNPGLAKRLASTGSFLADGYVHKSMKFQDYIDDVREGGAA